jgi:hypothetical protein
MLVEKNLNELRELNLVRLGELFNNLSFNTKSKTAVNSFDELLSNFVNVSVQGINLETDNMPYKYITVMGTIMKLLTEEEMESKRKAAKLSENEPKSHKNKKDITKKAKPTQIFHFSSKNRPSLELKREILEFVYRWKLEHSFKVFEAQQLDLDDKIKKAVSFTGEANA